MILRLEDLPSNTQAELLDGQHRPKGKAEESKPAKAFDFQLRAHLFTGWVREYRFAQSVLNENGRPRQWRFDFAHPVLKLAVEIEGLRVQQFFERTDRGFRPRMVCTGRHSTADGYAEDCRKYATAQVLGWQVLRFVQKQVKSGEAIAFVEQWYGARGITRSGP
jgi:hypothetical protein